MSKVLNYIFGSIAFTAQGGFPERFLNLCNVKGVKLYHLTESEGILRAETSLASFRKIRRCASRSGMRVKITAKKGLPFLYARFAKRTGLFAGIALACFLLFFYSRSVWSIEVKGNESIREESVIKALNENGIYEGVFKNEIDYHALTYALYDAVPGISWLNIGIDGSKLTVNLREAVQKPENKDEKKICNIVAAKSGVIDKMTVYEGESIVKEGYGVSEGQLLVSGVMYHEQAKRNTFHHSRAKIYAFTQTENVVKVPKTYLKTVYTGREKRYRVLRIFRLRLPLYLFTDHYAQKEVSVLKNVLRIKEKTLPISIDTYEVKETEQKREKVNKQTAAVLARHKKKAFEKDFSANGKILSVKTRLKEKKDCFVYTYSYEMYENIAKTAPIEISKQKNE